MPSEVLRLASELAKPFEGLRLQPYHDPAGYPTIGYGHLLSMDKHADLSRWQPISLEQAHELLVVDMSIAVEQASILSPILMLYGNTRRWAAIADFCFNLGAGKYKASTLRKRVNEGDWEGAKEQIVKWDKAGGKVLKGLVLRRAAEAGML